MLNNCEVEFFNRRGECLGLSRMETYLAVIKVLDNWDLMTQKQIMRKAALDLVSPKECLNFLVKLDLIIEKTLGNRTVYSITDKGQKLCNYFRLKDDTSVFGGTAITRID
jgi:predicted transcriptional regulator